MHIFTPRGRTHDAISRDSLHRWAEAVPASTYLLVLRNEETGRVIRRVWPLDTIEGATGWLRHMNAAGWSVMGRPWCGGRHVLVDDLNSVALECLTEAFTPSAIVESSPASYQAWITVSEAPVGAELAGSVARILARRFDGDIGATAWNQPGRVPGFTTRKLSRQSADGRYPYALLVSAEGPMVTAGSEELLAEAARGGGRTLPTFPPSTPPPPGRPRLLPRLPAEELAEATRRIHETLPVGAPIDRSRRDYAVARRLASYGAPPEHIASVLNTSEKLDGLAPAAADAYVERTIAAVLRSGRQNHSDRGGR